MQRSLSEGEAIARHILALVGRARTRARSAEILGANTARASEVLERELGDHVSPTETMVALDGSDVYVIRGVEITMDGHGLLSGLYTLQPTQSGIFEILDEVGFAELDEKAIA